MRHVFYLLPLAGLLSGCDNSGIPAPFTPEMASFANEFDFDPLRGPVRAFSQTLINEKGEITRRVSARLSLEGCFDLLELYDAKSDTVTTLLLNANYYIDARTQQQRILLQGKCQLAGMDSAAMQWDVDDSGFIITTHARQLQVSYRYDGEGYPLGKTSVSGNNRLAVVSTPVNNVRRKQDYTATGTLNGKVISQVTQSCAYDRHDNPVSCKLQTSDSSVTPVVVQRYTIKNSIDYY